MAKPKPDPEILDEVPWSDQVTDYDDKHFTTLRSRRRRIAIRALRPAAIAWGGRHPARPGVCRRHQRLPGLWRSPADRSRPDRSGLDPELSGGGRAAGGAPPRAPPQPQFEFAA